MPMSSRLSRRLLPGSFVLLLLACSTGRADDPFGDKIAPFMKTYCFKCHNDKKTEGLLDLTRYTSSALIAKDYRQWEHVITFLKEEKMPPKKAEQPAPDERAEFLASLDRLLLSEARKLANDPGAASPRRLSNAEYNYTIRDLTGFDIRPGRFVSGRSGVGRGLHQHERSPGDVAEPVSRNTTRPPSLSAITFC